MPVFWLVDSAGARLTDQVELFPGRRGAGRIFYNQNRLSGRVPQICCLFGPSAAGGAYIPAFCDVVIMVEGQRVHVPRLAAHGRDGGRGAHDARGDGRRPYARDRVRQRRQPRRRRRRRDRAGARLLRVHAAELAFAAAALRRRSSVRGRSRPTWSPATSASRSTCTISSTGLVDADSFFEVKPLFAPELIVGLRAPRRTPDRHRRQQLRAQGRRAVRRLVGQGGAVHLVL